MQFCLSFILAFSSLFSSLDFRAPLMPQSAAPTPGQFIITSAASGIAYSDLPVQDPFGGNNYLALYPLKGHHFATENGKSYNCDVTPLGICGGLQVQVAFFGGAKIFGAITYASPDQINVIIGRIPNFVNETEGCLFGVATATGVDSYAYPQPNATGAYTRFEKKALQPFLTYGTYGGVTGGFLLGTLYGLTVDNTGYPNATVFLKTLTDGKPNPRTYNGLPTIVQAYYSGIDDVGTDRPRFVYDGNEAPSFSTQRYCWEQSPGVFVTNHTPPFAYGGWGNAGVHDITFGYGNIVFWHQTTRTPGKIWFE